METEKIIPIAYPIYDFPYHPIALGGMFSDDQTQEREILAKYYSISSQSLQNISMTNANSSPVHIWPHHFDMAVLLSFPLDKSIGVGFSPGDKSYNQPYWYVSPWPYPTFTPPHLEIGFWHTHEWTGAVLTAEDMGDINSEKLIYFLQKAAIASRTIIEV